MNVMALLSNPPSIEHENTGGAVVLDHSGWTRVVVPGPTREPREKGVDSRPGDEVRLLAGVSMALSAVSGDLQRAEASKFVAQLRRALAKHDTRRFPAFRLALLEDGALVIEWTLADRRLGFSFEIAQHESGWYYAFASRAGGESDSGAMQDMDLTALLEKWFSVPLR